MQNDLRLRMNSCFRRLRGLMTRPVATCEMSKATPVLLKLVCEKLKAALDHLKFLLFLNLCNRRVLWVLPLKVMLCSEGPLKVVKIKVSYKIGGRYGKESLCRFPRSDSSNLPLKGF